MESLIRFRPWRFALPAALLVLCLSSARPDGVHSTVWPQPPSVAFGDLYRAVEMAGLFPDQKTFADAIPSEPPEKIMAEYEHEKSLKGFDLKAFVDAHFQEPLHPFNAFKPSPDQDVRAYIRNAWEALRREPDEVDPLSSLLPLSRPYVVPGGRFSEIYYWDSYFIMLGLEEDGRLDLARDTLDNFASLIDRYGHIPNGNRSYYLSRSQPPFFSLMVELVAAHDGDAIFVKNLPELEAEYAYWMDGAETLAPGSAYRHAVRLADGALLNRYWDDRADPRDESYRDDVETARRTNRAAADVYRDLRAGAETGWDFSSRWLADGENLWTIRTTDIVPADLNAIMTHLEQTLAKAYRLKGDVEQARRFAALADKRGAEIRRLMWNASEGFFADYLWREGRQSEVVSAATAAPLFFRIATPQQAHAVAEALRRTLLERGGLATTLSVTGQQWDRPNGWAPLQYMAIEGLKAYGEQDLAREIAARWIRTNLEAYARTRVLFEKFDIERSPGLSGGAGRGGEYPVQVGFGWTNGVLEKQISEYPELAPATESGR